MSTLKQARKLRLLGKQEEAKRILEEIVLSNEYPATLIEEAKKILLELTEIAEMSTPADQPAKVALNHHSKPPFTSKRVKPFHATIISWDAGHNCIGRAYVIFKLLKKLYKHTSFLSFQFAKFGKEIWPPLKSMSGEITLVEEPKTAIDLFTHCASVAPRIKTNLVVACKTKLPSLALAYYISRYQNCPVIIDIDDYDLGFLPKKDHDKYMDYSCLDFAREIHLHLNDSPISSFWTFFSHHLAKGADGKIVSNSALQLLYGGQVIPHLREGLTKDKRNIVDRSFQEMAKKCKGKKVIGFLGTPRRHKGVVTLAKAVARAKARNIVLVFIGTFVDENLRKEVLHASKETCILIDDIPFQSLSMFLDKIDVVALLQNTEDIASMYQLPAKAIDAIVMGKRIISTDTEPMRMLVQLGFKGISLLSSLSSLDEVLEKSIHSPLDASSLQINCKLSEKYLSYEAGTSVLKQTIDSATRRGALTKEFNYFNPLGSFVLPSIEILNGLRIQSNDSNPESHQQDKTIHIMLWKQNDFDVFGRRIDMIAKYLSQANTTDCVFVFERPLSTYSLDEMRKSNNPHHHLLHRKLLYKINGHKICDKLIALTPLHPAGLTDSDIEQWLLDYISEIISSHILSSHYGKEPPKIVLWIYPYFKHTTQIKKLLNPSITIVDIIDNHTTWPDLSDDQVKRYNMNYKEVLSIADFVVSNCTQNLTCFADMATNALASFLVPNGVDLDLCNKLKGLSEDSQVRALRKRLSGYKHILGYCGNLESKIDWDLIRAISSEFTDCAVLLIGSTHMATCKVELANVIYHGPLEYGDAAKAMSIFDVAIVPHLNNNLTNFMNPLKLYVYSTLGIPVICTEVENLPDTAGYAQLYIAKNTDDFLSAIRSALAAKRLRNEGKRNFDNDFITNNSWASRLNPFLHEIGVV